MRHEDRVDLICLAGTAWDGDNRKSVVELTCALGAQMRVLFVENPPTIRSLKRWPAVPGWLDRPADNVWRLTPHLALPANGLPPTLWRAAMAINRRRLAQVINQARRAMCMDRFILLNAWNPAYGLSLPGLPEPIRTIYYCYDDIGAAVWKARHGEAAERALLAEVDGVVASSPGLVRRCAAINPATTLVPNGVDFDSFQTPVAPHPLCRGVGPLVGYVGNIDHRFDASLVRQAAMARPDVCWLIVGRVFDSATDIDALARLPNVVMPGPIPVAEVPALIRGLDVGIIPFHRSRFTAGIYPLKVHEYLACGLSVVATDFAPIPDADPVIRRTDSPEAFIAAVDDALRLGTSGSAARVAVAQAASWPRRAGRLAEVLLGAA